MKGSSVPQRTPLQIRALVIWYSFMNNLVRELWSADQRYSGVLNVTYLTSAHAQILLQTHELKRFAIGKPVVFSE